MILVLNDPDRFISEPDWAADPDRFIAEPVKPRGSNPRVEVIQLTPTRAWL